MVEYIEELSVEPQLHALRHGKPLREIEIAPDKIGAPQRVAAKVPELAIFRCVASVASARARVDGRNKCIGIEPLNRSRLRDAGNEIVIVERHAGNDARKLRPAAVHNAISIR